MTEVAPLRDASTLTDEERHLIASFEPAVAALSALFGPGCEVVLHAFDSLHASVIKIANGHITGRQESAGHRFCARQVAQCRRQPVEQLFLPLREGTLLKSSSITISNREGKPIGMLCVNFSLDTPLGSLLDTFAPPAVPPAHGTETFASSVDDLVAQVIAKVDRDPGLGSNVRNKAIVHRLCDMGIFEIKDAAQLVAELLGISRHTVYLHIRNHKAELAEQQ
jgi:predicted transcriptional regulator YheO